MGLYYSDNFDADAVNALPAWWSNIAGTWQVIADAASAFSGANALESTSKADGDKVLLRGGSGVAIPAVADMTVTYVTKTLGTSTIGPMAVLRSTANMVSGAYIFSLLGSGGVIYIVFYKYVSGSLSQIANLSTGVPIPAVGAAMRVKASVIGSTLGIKLWLDGNAEPASPQQIATDSSITAPGYAGFYLIGPTPGGYGVDNVTVSDNTTLAAGSISFSGISATSLTATATAVAGGTGPYTYQWYRSTSAGFVPQAANAISGATSLALNDTGLSTGTTYYYMLVATDSNGAIAWSSQAGVTPTSGVLTSGTASSGSVGTKTGTVAVGGSSGGTTPYSYQWYRSTSSGFIPGAGNMVSGATSTTLNDTGLSPMTTYYYKCVVTDSASATATSNQVTVTTIALSPIVAGNIYTTLVRSTQVQLSADAPTGGNGSFSNQWYRSNSLGTLGTAIPGATGQLLTDTGLSPGTDYYYTLVCTDSASDPSANSAQLHVTTLASSAVELVGGIGDSIMYGFQTSQKSAFNCAVDALNNRFQNLKEFLIPAGGNQSIGGKTSIDWLPSGSLLASACSALNSAGVTRLLIMLGTNDSKPDNPGGATSPATYQGNMSSIIAYCKAHISSLKTIHVFSSPYLNGTGDLTSANNPILVDYAKMLPGVADNVVTYYSYPLDSFTYFKANGAAETADGVHPNDIGAHALGSMWANGVTTVFAPSGGIASRARLVNGH